MEDIKLLWLLHQNPSAGMEQLMNQYLGLVYAVVKGKLLDSVCPSSDVEDCVADVFSELKKADVLERMHPLLGRLFTMSSKKYSKISNPCNAGRYFLVY